MATHWRHLFFDDPSHEVFISPDLAASPYACGLLFWSNVCECGR